MHLTLALIGVCWLGWLVYWIAMAFANKRTIERSGFFGYRVAAIVTLLVMFAIGRLLHVAPQNYFWHTPLALGIVTVCVVLTGIAITVWARITLGQNWSAEVTFKQDHELIRSGPYALARHPIYTGLLLMALGTAIDYGRAAGFALFLAVCASLWWKVRLEEQIMSRHFSSEYSDYKQHVRAIIPFVL
jgi:protein-S-isoprenylcysteine O-methyltransferase Ste14